MTALGVASEPAAAGVVVVRQVFQEQYDKESGPDAAQRLAGAPLLSCPAQTPVVVAPCASQPRLSGPLSAEQGFLSLSS